MEQKNILNDDIVNENDNSIEQQHVSVSSFSSVPFQPQEQLSPQNVTLFSMFHFLFFKILLLATCFTQTK